MVELSNFPTGKEKKLDGNPWKDEGEVRLSLSKEENKAKTIEIRSSLVVAEAFYQDVLRFAISVMDKVASGGENDIDGADILANADRFYKILTTSINPDDLLRLVAQHDEMHKNNYIYIQAINVCFVSVRIALSLKFSAKELRELLISSLFHDIGMMKIPMAIWNKNERLNPSEEKEVEKHPIYSEEIFRKIKGMDEEIILAIAQHQEKADGSGYPKHLKGNEIYHLARLIGLVDRYEAQTHTRPWRARYAPDHALQHILDNESNSYDPYYMKAMLRYVSIFPVGSWVKISSGEIGNVVRTNEDSPMRPVISISFDRDRKIIPEPRIMDLSKQLLVHVEHCVNPEHLNVL
ncbi:MAG: HD domain-containing protein [Candidatus Omnitrophica bacterium]|nr:HD domain-containing protein [Candidatus Omnitrophota bacterium]